MAFLDNSGDIILDAVLTDLGRKRMAEGNFSITQFSLGDDEIDYSLYNKNHPSGSAYYDLEILQTPIFEAFTRENSNINYGLATFDGSTNLFYLPRLVLNQKRDYNPTTKLQSGVVYVAVNSQTFQELIQTSQLGEGLIAQTDNPRTYFSFETGIDNNNDPAGTPKDRSQYILQQGLNDNEIELSCDNRFISAIYGIAGGKENTFSYNNQDVRPAINITPLGQPRSAQQSSTTINNFVNYVLDTTENLIFDQRSGQDIVSTNVSEITGPRGYVTAFAVGVSSDMQTDSSGATPAKFSLYGRTDVPASELDGIASGVYDILDTIVYLRARTSGANTQLVVRLIRKVS